MMGELGDLLDRCKTSGLNVSQSRELDVVVATTIGGYVLEKRGRDRQAWFYPVDGISFRRQLHGVYGVLPRYTTSVDAALALAKQTLKGPRADLWRFALKDALEESFDGDSDEPQDLARLIVIEIITNLLRNKPNA